MTNQKNTSAHDSVPATVGLVKAVREELSSKIDAVEHRLTARIGGVEQSLSAKIEQVMVSVHRTQVLMEEQRGENKIVLDGLKNVNERQDRMETEFGELRNTVRSLSASVKR